MRNALLLAILSLVLASSTSIRHAQDKITTAIPTGSRVDMSYTYNAQTTDWPTPPDLVKKTSFEGVTAKGYYYLAYPFTTAQHGGKHRDALIHLTESQQVVDEIPTESFDMATGGHSRS